MLSSSSISPLSVRSWWNDWRITSYGTETAQRRTFYAVKGSKLPHNGDGCVKLSSGAVTTGCFANGELSLGVFTYGSGVGVHDGLDGGVYKGSFGKDFTFHGTGTLTYANGTVLRATWTDGACSSMPANGTKCYRSKASDSL